MTDKPEPSALANKSLHPVYTVTNITNKVRLLDGVKVSYSSWVKLFTLHARGYKVLAHIDGTPPPAETDDVYESWCEIDAIVLQWIYGTLSDDLLVRVLESKSTAYEAWCRLKTIFLNNKGSRAAALEHEFTNLTLKAMPSLEAYSQRLKDLGDQLNDVDCPVNNQRLVLQLVRGLPAEYDTVAAYINQTLPTWETACSMLALEHQRQSAREALSPPSALAAVAAPDSSPSPLLSRRRSSNRQPNHRQPAPPQSRHSSAQSRPSNPRPSYPFWPYWSPPPCPYPTTPGWASPWPAAPPMQPTWQHHPPTRRPEPASGTRTDSRNTGPPSP